MKKAVKETIDLVLEGRDKNYTKVLKKIFIETSKDVKRVFKKQDAYGLCGVLASQYTKLINANEDIDDFDDFFSDADSIIKSYGRVKWVYSIWDEGKWEKSDGEDLDGFLWMPGAIKPRMKFLREVIEYIEAIEQGNKIK